MDSKPLSKLLDRDLAKVSSKEIINIASPLLQELVNFSTNVFGRCLNSTKREFDFALMFTYLHMIEMADGIEVLISQSCSIPAAPLLRSSFEALLSIEYILDKDYGKRARSWMVGFLRDRRDVFILFNPESDRGKRFINAFNKEIELIKKEIPEENYVKQKIKDLNEYLDQQEYSDVNKEWQRSKKDVKGRLNWFSLYNGPRSIRELAVYLKRETQYNLLYNQWSSITHARDISRFWGKTSDNHWGLYSLRNSKDLKLTISLTSTFLLDTTFKIIKQFREDEFLVAAKWYYDKIKNDLALMDP